MASDAPASHLLSLKVMRVSRPALASAWQPFYSSSPSFSAHSTQSILSLQGTTPLSGHPKTLRDLTQASELLTLPSSFGSIQLGETFSSCLAVNNEATTEIDSATLKVEMQTATSKIVLGEIHGKLPPGDTLESVVHHEIKELGQHVLACTVSYHYPQNSRASQEPSEPHLLTFRKFYKFVVTNPLSVKTKVHAPKSPSAMIVPAERDKVFLEIHIQNLTPEPVWFERMYFDAVDGWEARDVNVVDVEGAKESLYTGSTALMQPQDMRQYIFILTPKQSSLEPVVHAPGSIIPLGRLDLSWRSSYGEPGRLLTSMLTRRIPLPPLPPPAQPASALPPYLKRTSASVAPPARPRSPQLTQSRPASPTPRPTSPPYRARASSVVSGFSQIPPSPQLPPANIVPATPIDVNLALRETPVDSTISVGKAFKIPLTLMLSSVLGSEKQRQRLQLSLVIQHLTYPPLLNPATATSSTVVGGATSLMRAASQSELSSLFSPPALSSPGFSSPSPTFSTFNYPLAHQKLLAASQEQQQTSTTPTRELADLITLSSSDSPTLPPPYFTEKADETKRQRMSIVTFAGPSAIRLPAVELKASNSSPLLKSGSDPSAGSSLSSASDAGGVGADTGAGGASWPSSKHQTTVDFDLNYIPLKQGFATIGGLRLLLVGEHFVVEDEEKDGSDGTEKQTMGGGSVEVRTLKEWNVIREVWVS